MGCEVGCGGVGGVSVGDSVIAQSSKVRDLGVIFDQFLKFMGILAVFVGQHIFI